MDCEVPSCLTVGYHLHVIYVPPGLTLERVWDDIRLFDRNLPVYGNQAAAQRATVMEAHGSVAGGEWFIVTPQGVSVT